MGKPMSEVARNAVFHIRLPLLTPDELKVVEKESTKDALVPVSIYIDMLMLTKCEWV